MKQHTLHSDTILGAVPGFERINEWASSHHERLNGTGYHRHKSDGELSQGARILAVADVFTAITEDRPYRLGMDDASARKVLQDMSTAEALDDAAVTLLLDNYAVINEQRRMGQEAALIAFQMFNPIAMKVRAEKKGGRIMGALRVFMRMVKIEHSIFALPFAYIGAFLAAGGWPGWRVFLALTMAMVAVRSFAMAYNRLVDLPFDRLNPRTKDRPLVTGEISPMAVKLVCLGCGVVFFVACATLNELCLTLAGPALLLSGLYSFTKRFTWLCHFCAGRGAGACPAGRLDRRGAGVHARCRALRPGRALLGGRVRHPLRLPGHGL